MHLTFKIPKVVSLMPNIKTLIENVQDPNDYDGVLMVMVKNNFEEPKAGDSDDCHVLDWMTDECSYENGEVTKKMSFAPKMFIVGAGSLAGILVGKAIPAGWKKVYPAEGDKVSFNIESRCNRTMLNLQVSF